MAGALNHHQDDNIDDIKGFLNNVNTEDGAKILQHIFVGNNERVQNNLAKKTGITEKLILKWANHADLIRIKGIGGEYSELLEAAGVDTVPELAKRKPENLYAKMVEVNEAKKLVRKLPTQMQVEDWIKQAANLPRVLKY